MTIEPGKIIAGDSVEWSRTLQDYPASAGYTLHYALFSASAVISIDSTADGDDHLVSVSAATTGKWTAGRYDWSAYVTGPDGYRKSLLTGAVIISPDPSKNPHDGRSHARKVLEAIEAYLENKASSNQLDIIKRQFGERITERTPEKLILWRDTYRREVQAEEQAAALARGESLSNKIKIRFI